MIEDAKEFLMTKRAVGYTRVSTEKQAKEGESLATQQSETCTYMLMYGSVMLRY